MKAIANAALKAFEPGRYGVAVLDVSLGGGMDVIKL